MAAEEYPRVQQFYCLTLCEKSAGREGIRRSKCAAILRLLRSLRFEKTVINCIESENSEALEAILSGAGFKVATSENSQQGPDTKQGIAGPIASTRQVYVTAEFENATADIGSLIINLDLPKEALYMQSLCESDAVASSGAIVTCVTPLELVDLKGYTQPNREGKIKPVTDILSARHVKDGVQGTSVEEFPVTTDAHEMAAETKQATGQHSTLAPEHSERSPLADEQLEARKQRLLQSLHALIPHQNGSAQAAATPDAAQKSSQNGPAPQPVITQGSEEGDVPPPPLGSPPSAGQAAAASAGFGRLPGSAAAAGASSAAHGDASAVSERAELGRSPGALQPSPEAAGRRGRPRSAQDAAARKEEQQELALERAILEIHWQHAEAEEEADSEESEDPAEDKELEEGELNPQGLSTAEDQTSSGRGAQLAWHQHLPQFYQEWGRAAADHAAASAGGGGAADTGADPGQGSDAQAAAWDDWYRQQGYGGQDAYAQQHGAATSSDRGAGDWWQEWQNWQQQQQGGCPQGSAQGWSSWGAAAQPSGHSGGPVSWAAQGAGKEEFVSVPVTLLQRYQMLEWAEWCRQYERWQAAYEQWYSWWCSQAWQGSGCYGAGTDQDTSAT